MKPKKAIVLVAGLGTRLKPLTNTMPKCLIEVNGKSIIANALEKLEQNGIEETILVIGHLGDKVKEVIRDRFRNMKINYVENDIYDKTNNSYSLWLAIKDLDEDLLILEGDVFFENRLLKELLDDEREDVTAVEKYNPKLDGTFVDVWEGVVKSWVHKKDRPEGFTVKDKFKTINMHKFSKNFVGNWIMPVLKKHVEETNRTEPIEFIFKEIIKDGGKINAYDAKGIKWFEIDNVEELKITEEIFRDKVKKLRVLLIDPHYRPGRTGPNIGLAYICAAVKECADIKLMHFYIKKDLDFDEFLDAEKRFIEDIKREIGLDYYDVVSITGTSGTYPRMLRIAEAVKKTSPDSLFVVGGPHITIMEASRWKNRIFKDSPYVDVTVKGEGEETFKELLYAISNKKGFNDIKGISYRKKDDFFSNPLREIPDINKLLIPDYEKFDMNHFSKLPFYISASRGCKYNCLFCDERRIFNCYRPRDPRLLIEELKILASKYGVKRFWFGDSSLTSHPKLMELCDLIIKEKLGIEFMCFGRVNEVNPEMLKKLKEAGCFCIYYGIESGNQEVLNWMRKGATLEQIKEAVKMSKDIGLAIMGSFIIGSPPETKEMALETIRFAKSLNINVEHWHIFEPSIDFLENAPEEYDVDWKSMETDIPVNLADELVKRMEKRGDALSFDRHFVTHVKGNVNDIKSPFSKIPYQELQKLIHKAQKGAGDH